MIDADPVVCARLSLVLISGFIAYLGSAKFDCALVRDRLVQHGQPVHALALKYLVRVLLVDEANSRESWPRGQAIASRSAAHAVVRDSQDDHRQHPDL
jgi:hypothetical protein